MSVPLLVVAWAAVALAPALSFRTARSAWHARSAAEALTPFVTDYSVDPPLTPTWLVVAQLVAGLSCGLAVWLTFAPPAFYRRRIRGAGAGA